MNHQSGQSLLELLISVAVLGVVLWFIAKSNDIVVDTHRHLEAKNRIYSDGTIITQTIKRDFLYRSRSAGNGGISLNFPPSADPEANFGDVALELKIKGTRVENKVEIQKTTKLEVKCNPKDSEIIDDELAKTIKKSLHQKCVSSPDQINPKMESYIVQDLCAGNSLPYIKMSLDYKPDFNQRSKEVNFPGGDVNPSLLASLICVINQGTEYVVNVVYAYKALSSVAVTQNRQIAYKKKTVILDATAESTGGSFEFIREMK